MVITKIYVDDNVIDNIATAIETICDNGGCPPNKDCDEDQNCHECVIKYLKESVLMKE